MTRTEKYRELREKLKRESVQLENKRVLLEIENKRLEQELELQTSIAELYESLFNGYNEALNG